MFRRLLLCLALLGAAAAHGTPFEDPVAEQRANWLTAGAVSLVAGYGMSAWWRGELSSNFRLRSEGWFGQETYAGGADKLGHAYSTYLGTRLLARAYEETGLTPRRALERAAWVSGATLLGVEVLDGFSKKFRFSPEDAVLNLAGVGTAVLLERNPGIDRVVDLRLLYRRSPEAREKGVRDPIDDTSGQTYLLALKASGVDALDRLPGLRYLELVFGYGSRGYRPEIAGHPRTRHFYAGLGIDLAELLNTTVFAPRQPPSRAQRLSTGVLEYLQLPGTVLLHDQTR